MARIEDHKYSIEEAFRECFYIVPDYQREYVWTEKEVQQLLEDVNEQFDTGEHREYFIGTVLVSPTQQKIISRSSTVSSGSRRSFSCFAHFGSASKASLNTRSSAACLRPATPIAGAI